jgi:hypothetical protein
MSLLVAVLSNTYNFELHGRQMKGQFQTKNTSIEFSTGDAGIVLTARGDGASACLAHLSRCHAAGREVPMAAGAAAS